jgi:NAD(P)-dependent dehydrogenase (short-subunit alcohol dehydrogenase family)
MEQLKGRVAVITGGASGIGKSLAQRFALEGMKLVVADIEDSALQRTVAELRDIGAEAIGVQTDVTSFESVQALAAAAFAEYGKVHVLCNNAGVGPPSSTVWETTPNDWKWTFSVNVFGVAHGIQAFVPLMLESGEEGIVINTSSPDGPIAPLPAASVYAASKCAVTCLTECLDAQLRSQSDKIRAAVFYPSGQGLLDTGLWTSDRNRPADLARERPRTTPAMTIAQLTAKGMPLQPLDELSAMVVDCIRDGRFVMLLNNDKAATTLRERIEKFSQGANPTEMHHFG